MRQNVQELVKVVVPAQELIKAGSKGVQIGNPIEDKASKENA